MSVAEQIFGNPKKAFLMIEKETAAAGRGKNLAQGLKKMGRLLSAGGSPGGKPAGNQEVLRVQYNPSSLRFSANTEPIQIKSPQKGSLNEEPAQASRPASISLSVELIFEAIENADAFMADKARLSAGSLLKGAKGIYQNIVKGGYSVQPQVNGLIALMLLEDTKAVTFQWADLAFRGIVEQADAEYTMFNLAGHPIMAKISLEIMQKLEESADLKYWDKAFDRCFLEASGSAGKGLIAQAGNLIQFNS